MSRRALPSVAVLCALVAAPSIAAAGEAEQEAERLFVEGKSLLDAGSVSSACVAFDRSNALDPAEGTLLALGLCHEREAKWSAAREELSVVLDSAKKSGREDRRRVAAAALERVRAKVSAAPAPEEPRAAEPEVERPSEVASAAATREPSRADVSPEAAAVPWLPIAVGGAGALAAITGGIFGARAYAKWDDVSARCDPNACADPNARGDLDQARTAATTANVLIGSGVVLGVVAAVLYFTGGHTKKSGANSRLLTLTTGPHGVAGTF